MPAALLIDPDVVALAEHRLQFCSIAGSGPVRLFKYT